MQAEGGCYCGALRYAVDGKAMMKGECYCRPCQHNSGGGPNYFMLLPAPAFTWTKGEPKGYSKGHKGAVTRHFCETCGTQIITTRPDMDGVVVLKIGTLDKPAIFGGAKMAIFTEDRQDFHRLSEEFPAFERLPG